MRKVISDTDKKFINFVNLKKEEFINEAIVLRPFPICPRRDGKRYAAGSAAKLTRLDRGFASIFVRKNKT